MTCRLVLVLCSLLAGCHLLLPFQAGDTGVDRPVVNPSRPDGGPDRLLAPVGCAYQRRISVPAGTVSGGQDLDGFPLLVTLSNDAKLRSRSNGGNVEEPHGYDIRFLGSDGKTTLQHEVEAYDGVTGTLRAWVRTRLSVSSETVLYLCYGDPSITSSTEQRVATWGPEHLGVWHLQETSGQRSDSTGRANHLGECNGVVGAAEGRVGGGAVFAEKLQSYLCIADAKQSGLDPPGPMTISLWMRTDVLRAGWRNLVAKWAHHADGPDPNDSYYLGVLQNGPTNQSAKIAMEGTAGDGQVVGQLMIATGVWHHLAAVYDGSKLALFVDGVPDQTYPYSSGARDSATEFAVGGKGSALDYGHDGVLDEVRIANVARSAGWITAEHEAAGLYKMELEEKR